jgi:predicted enzyme related to lactoylglutathione lyase
VPQKRLSRIFAGNAHTRVRLIFVLAIATFLATGRTREIAAQAPLEAGAFVWYDLMTTKLAASREFYGKLLGWSFKDTVRNGRPYVIASAGGRPIAGLIEIDAKPDAGPQWVSFFLVNDVAAATKEAESAGGKVLVPPTNVGSGEAAVIADSQGAPVGIGHVTLKVPTVAEAKNGQFFWTDYMATDGEAAVRFYQRVAGYTADTPTALGKGQHILLRNGARPRAGLFILPEEVKNVRSHWLPHVRVDDPAALAARATSLGGRVMLAPSANVRNNTLAIVADPAGAPIALQKWPIQ